MSGSGLLSRDIDRLSAEPFYLQLSRMVERAIGSGEFRAGDRPPGRDRPRALGLVAPGDEG